MFKKFVATLLPLSTISFAYADDWELSVQPYIHAVTIEGKSSLGRVDAEDVNVDFGQILETLNMGAMVNVKAVHSSGWGGSIDYAFMDLRDDLNTPRGGVLDGKVKQAVLQAELVYLEQKNDASLEYLLGLRRWDNDVDLDFDSANGFLSPSVRKDLDWVDYFVGARWIAPINDDWEYMVRGDIGAGDSDFTSSVEAGVHYIISDSSTLSVKYKSTWVDYDEGKPNQQDYFKYDTTTHGPAVAYTYQF
jgi:hypothetical protein